MFDIVKLCQNNGIEFSTTGKNIKPGWIGLKCCFCNDTSNHLGFGPNGEVNCWRCGGHSTADTVAGLLRISKDEAWAVVKQYGGAPRRAEDGTEEPVRIGTKKFKHPSSTGPMTGIHRRYLESRRFDPDELERTWRLLGTGPVALLDGLNFKFRVIAPIFWNGAEVSFQARDVTGQHQLRYITCPKEREVVFHKKILYGLQDEWRETGIIVEGITDVWRLGPRACATFGTKYTETQVREIAKHFKRVFVIFDNEKPAQKQARQLAADLCARKVVADVYRIAGDPGDMRQRAADHLVKELTS
jgi:hypothetical protein